MSKRDEEVRTMAQALEELVSSEAAGARSAARLLNRKSRDNWTQQKKEWFQRADTISALLRSTSHADEATLVYVIEALGWASQRYDCNDVRILDTLAALYPHARDKVRIAIAQAIPHFGTRQAWTQVLDTLDARPKKAAEDTVAFSVARYGKSIPPDLRPRFSKSLFAVATSQRDKDILAITAKALALVCSHEDLPALGAWLARTRDPILREDIDEAIAVVRAKSPVDPHPG
jgi:hypothetical protein